MKITLKMPVQFGKELIEELELKPTGRAMRGLRVESTGNGGFVYEPFAYAVAGLKMAGHVASAEAIADRLHPADQQEIATAVLSFFVTPPTSEPSKAGSTP